MLTGDRVWEQPWPAADLSLLERDTVEVVLKVNGKLRDRIQAALPDVLTETRLPSLTCTLRGKVRDNYDLADGRRLIVATDRQSAFDQVLAAVPFKGQVLTAVARFWFEATADLCRNHVLAFPGPNVTVAKRLSMLPVEVVSKLVIAHLRSMTPRPVRSSRR